MSRLRQLVKALRVLGACDRRWWLALRRGVAPSLEHLRVLRLLRPSSVIDIGANRGQFALAVRHVLPQAAIDSFEPLPEPAAVFRRVFAGDTRVTLHACAIGERAGTTSMHVSARDD